jgi:phosphatidylglycerophosphatase A
MTPRAPDRSVFFHPAHLIATCFGVGYTPYLPGSFASLLAAFTAYGVTVAGNRLALGIALAIVSGAGFFAVRILVRQSEQKDPPQIVVDEVAGMWLTLLFAPFDWRFYGIGFLTFRLFDVLKPWPVSVCERKLPGALGVMADDFAAGAMAAICVAALAWALGFPGV